ncbi:MAG: hypothetical protein K2J39_04175, partial [Ruminococcus sp.]|nr:hypothetical protein [Ruminococcus sp.]
IISGIIVILDGSGVAVVNMNDDETTDISVSESYSEPAPETVSETTAEIITEIPSKTVPEIITEDITDIISENTAEIFSDDNSYVEYHFRNEKLLNQHFEKHGSEFTVDFNYQTAEEYEHGASNVINNPDALFKYEAEDGDGVYYIEDSNEFVILSTDGYIRTYFRPSGKIDYFNKQ